MRKDFEREELENEARLELIRSLLDKLPTFDPYTWSGATQEHWFKAFGRLYRRIESINAFGQAIRELNREIGRLRGACRAAMEMVDDDDSELHRFLTARLGE